MFEAEHCHALSYAELLNQSLRIGSLIEELDIGRGDRVAIVMPNGPWMASAFIGLLPWCVTAPLNPAYTQSEFEFYLDDLNIGLLVTLSGFETVASSVAHARHIKTLELNPTESAGGFSLASSHEREISNDLEKISLILHTSGTTSRPKMVPLTERNVLASARNITETLALRSSDKCLNVMPLFHIHGLIAPILATVYSGGSVFCTSGFDVLRFFSLLDEVKPTWYSAVPTMHQAIVARASRNQSVLDRAQLRFIRSSSASLPVPVLHELEHLFDTTVVEAYAMTEAAHQMCSNPLPPRKRKPGMVGTAAGPEVEISNPDSLSFRSVGEEGEIVIRGENVTSGYLNNNEANRKSFVCGWFRTGDLGYKDIEGYVKVTGRLKEIINRGGEKIAPLEVDEVLLDHPSVAQACTYAVPHDKLGEDVGACIVLNARTELSRTELQEFVRSRLAAFKVPRTIHFVDDIPKGPTGKVQRIGLAERLAELADG